MISAIFKMAITNIKHKVFIFQAGRRMGGFSKFHLLKHDLSKFSRAEFMHYVRRFNMGNPDPQGFDKAWAHHWKNNDHHIEYWEEKNLTFSGLNIGKKKSEGHTSTEFWMHDTSIREMVADWMAACRAYDGYWPDHTNWKWGDENLERITKKLEATMQPETTTRGFLLEVLHRNGMISDQTYKELNVL